MDRVNGTDWVDIGGGRRGFRSQNAAAGIAGTEVTEKILNDIQEEICAVIENSGFELDPENQQQLWEALLSISAPGFANRTPWLPVLSMTTIAPPNDAVLGDAYIIPAGATGAWGGNQQKLAEWTGSRWRIVDTKDGHGVALPDGRCFEKIGGTYVEKLALDVQAGKWNYVTAAGSANALTASLSPAPASYTNGMLVLVGISITSTSTTPTLNLNSLGAKSIVNPDGSALTVGALVAGAKQLFAFDAALNKFILMTPANTGVKLGNGWIRHSDGTYEAWGVVTFPGTTTQLDVTLPVTFPTSVDSVLVTDVGSSVFVGAANALSNSQIRCWTTPYFVNNTGTISQKNGAVLLWYRAWGK